MDSGFGILIFWAVAIGIWLFYHITTEDERRRWYLDWMPIVFFFIVLGGVIEAFQVLF